MTARASLTQEVPGAAGDRLVAEARGPRAHQAVLFEISLKNETAMKNQKASGGAISVAVAVGGAAGVMVIGAMAGGGDVGASLSNAGGMIAGAHDREHRHRQYRRAHLPCIAECAGGRALHRTARGCVEPLGLRSPSSVRRASVWGPHRRGRRRRGSHR